MKRIAILSCVLLIVCAPVVAKADTEAVSFIEVRSVADLDHRLQNLEGRPALLKVSSDWSITGGEMDRHFASETLRRLIETFVLLEFDVTDHTDDDQKFLSRYEVSGTPWVLFFDGNGAHIADQSIAGYLDEAGLAVHIRGVLEN